LLILITIAGQSRKYYVISLIDVHASLALLIFYAIFGFNLLSEDKYSFLIHVYFYVINFAVNVIMFTFIPFIVQKLSFSNFNPFSFGQTYIQANIFKWFLVICVGSLGAIIAMQEHIIAPINRLRPHEVMNSTAGNTTFDLDWSSMIRNDLT
jgi:hypothetical protein